MCVDSERREANIFHHGVPPPRVPPPMTRADIIDSSLPLIPDSASVCCSSGVADIICELGNRCFVVAFLIVSSQDPRSLEACVGTV